MLEAVGKPMATSSASIFQKLFGSKHFQTNTHIAPITSTMVVNPDAEIKDITQWTLLEAEAMTAKQWKAMLAGVNLLLALATAAFIVLLVIKHKVDDYHWFRRSDLLLTNLCFAAFCFALLLAQICRSAWRYYIVLKDPNLTWLPRRRMTSHLAFLRILTQAINVGFWMAQQAYVLGFGCTWFNQFVNWSTIVQWTCFNTIFCLDTIYAHGLCPWVDKDGQPQRHAPGGTFDFIADPIIMDAPFRSRHFPKLIAWLLFEASIVFFAVHMSNTGGVSIQAVNTYNKDLQELPNCKLQHYDCKECAVFLTFLIIWVVGAFCHSLSTYWFMAVAQERLDMQPYTCYERTHKMLMGLKRNMGWHTTLSLFSITCVYVSDPGNCRSFLLAWLGVLPLQVVTTAVALFNSAIYMPRTPFEGAVVQQAWLKDFVWLEEDELLKRRKWASWKSTVSKAVNEEPIFCFSNAAKLLLWSDMVYTHDSVPNDMKEGRDNCCPACNILWCGCFTIKQDEVPGTPQLPVALPSADAVQNVIERPTITMTRQAHTSSRETRALDASPGYINAAEASGINGQEEEGGARAYDSRIGPRGADKGPLYHRRECSGNQADAIWQAEMQSPGSRDDHSRCCSGALSSVQGGLKELRLEQNGCLADEESHVQIQVEEKVSSRSQLELSMRLFGLKEFEVYHNPLVDTKVLIGWSDSQMVMAFRGTASLTNAFADIKVWRLPHGPVQGNYWLGSQPMVHSGFQQSWTDSGLCNRVVDHVRQVISKASVPSKDFKIYLTGHSLGGALATLAALDIKRKLPDLELRVYTFGSPRTGNHAFAAEYNLEVPDTWHIINDHDAVPRSGKLFMLYKRPGHRVLVNQYGDMRVRPDHFQVNLHTTGFSVKQHYLKAYRGALASIIAAQLMQYKGMEGGKAAVLVFSRDPNMHALFSYIGINLAKLVQMPAGEITERYQRAHRNYLRKLGPKSLWRGLRTLMSNALFFFMGESVSVNVQLLMQRMTNSRSVNDSSTGAEQIFDSREFR